MTRRLFAAVAGAAVMAGGAAQAQTAFRGDCDQANKYASSVAFRSAYRGVQRITPPVEACGRDVVAAYNLSLKPGSSAEYDMVARYYYLWPTAGAGCGEEVYDRLAGTVRITQQVKTVGLLCEVNFVLEFDITADEMFGPNKFSKLVTLIGADSSRFTATLPNSAEAMIFYEAPVSLVQPAGSRYVSQMPSVGPGPDSLTVDEPYYGPGWEPRLYDRRF